MMKKHLITALLGVYLVWTVLHWWSDGQFTVAIGVFALVAIATYAGHRRLGGLSGLLFVAVHMGIEAPHMAESLSQIGWVALGALLHLILDLFFFYHEWRHEKKKSDLLIAVAAYILTTVISVVFHDHSRNHGHGMMDTIVSAGIAGCAGFHVIARLKRGKCSH